ncbi:MAG: xanthine dehydrogenase family protein molybdopterin-binding subunit [Actinomycetota bacterium]
MSSSIFGSVVLRSEDPRFVRGEGRYVANLPLEGALHAVFVRSMMPHARLNGVDTSAAAAMPGVAAVRTANDLEGVSPIPASGNIADLFAMPVLAVDRVRYAGEAIAVVLAETIEQAVDAAELVAVDYDPLPAVVGFDAALAVGSPALFPEHGSNVCDVLDIDVAPDREATDPLLGAEVIARGTFVNQRLAPVPMETNAFAARPEPGGGLTVWASTQIPFDVRDDLADAFGLRRDQVRCIAPDVGGGFGAKLVVYPEYFVLAGAALDLGRPVRWTQPRAESMTAITHGRAQRQVVELGATRDGTIVGMRVHLTQDLGAYPIGGYLVATTAEMVAGVYRIPRIAVHAESIVTNATPIQAYRGAGRPEATALIERAIDLLANELSMDPVLVRRRNLIGTEAFPYDTGLGPVYDSGDYGRALDLVLELADIDDLRSQRDERRVRGDRLQLGIGVSTYVEITAFAGKEFGGVQVHPDGSVTVLAGTSSHGQGHETAFAQLVSGLLGVPFAAVEVVHSDTGRVPKGDGTYASRSLQLAGSALWEQSGRVIERAKALAADELEVEQDDIVFSDGAFGVAGAPDRSLSWAELATVASDGSREGSEQGLAASGVFRQSDSTFPFGAHLALVEVDTETGDVRLRRHVAVDDCGRILNPMLVDGQVHGGLAQGIAQALFEEVVYDDDGNPLTATLSTYAMASAAELVSFENAHTETPTPHNPLGVKGIGEAATIGSTPAVQNAVVDALARFGVKHLDMPASPERVWRAIQAKRTAGA